MNPVQVSVEVRSLLFALMAALAASGCAQAPQPEVGDAVPADAAASERDVASSPAAQPVTGAAARVSRYTSLRDGCRVVERDEETGGSRSLCPGIGGYRLAVIDGDARMTVEVLPPPQGEPSPLGLSTIAGGAFSSLGARAEWRSGGAQPPDALIVRYEAFEFPEQPERSRSYLVVAKLSAQANCVVAVLPPGPAQNEQARKLADRAQAMPCLMGRGAGAAQ